MLKNSSKKTLLILYGGLFAAIITLVFNFLIKSGTRIDYHTNDYFYNKLSGSLINFPKSDQIVYLTITDDTYKKLFKKNALDRKILADALIKLSAFNPQSVIIDIIFAYPSDLKSDNYLLNALTYNDVYLPISFALSHKMNPDKEYLNKNRFDYLNNHLYKPVILNGFNALKSGRSILQLEKFGMCAKGIGHISDFSDTDGIVRHSLVIIPIDTLYIPSLYFKAYLDYVGVPVDSIIIDLGKNITLPALKNSWLNHDVEIPADENGRTLIPFVNKWPDDFPMLSLLKFMELSKDKANDDALNKFFEGKFVILGDVSTGIADIASTSVNKSAPLITIQANMLNSLLQQKFIEKFSVSANIIIILSIILILTFTALFENQKIFYRTFLGTLFLFGVFYLILLINLKYINVISILISYLIFSGGLLTILEISTYKGKKIIEADNIRRTLEMDEARKIQISMLPQKMPDLNDLKIAAYLRTASEVGGDYYDFFIDSKNRLRIVIGDATGHGLKAGTMVTIIKTLFSTFREYADLKDMLNRMSAIIKDFRLSQLFICIAVFIYESKRIRFTSAGMPPVIIFRKKLNITDSITLKGMPLGVWNNFPYETAEFSLEEGDTVLLSSDGLMELFNKDDEMFGMERIEEIFRKNAEKEPEQILDVFKKTIFEWTKGIEPQDDITILVLKSTDK